LTDGKSKFEYCVSVITHICLISHVFFFYRFLSLHVLGTQIAIHTVVYIRKV